MWDHRLKLWNTMGGRARIRRICSASSATRPPPFLAGFRRSSSPATTMRPALGRSRRFMQRRKVLLPEPLERSEEHTSELQSLMRNSYAVFCLKKKTKQTPSNNQAITKRNDI